jgi:isopenicillin N synthase-like dioxygenase
VRATEINDRIPLLDLRRFDAGEAQRAAFLADLRAAAHDIGFFYVTGHDVETRLLRDLMESARAARMDPQHFHFGTSMPFRVGASIP